MENTSHHDAHQYNAVSNNAEPDAYSSFPPYAAPLHTDTDVPTYSRFNPFTDPIAAEKPSRTAEADERESAETDKLLTYDFANESDDSLESEENDEIMAMKFGSDGPQLYPEIGDDQRVFHNAGILFHFTVFYYICIINI